MKLARQTCHKKALGAVKKTAGHLVAWGHRRDYLEDHPNGVSS